ncbi:MAG: hypothetical protein ACJ762_06355 [Solirubrobacteraceae bacterium]
MSTDPRVEAFLTAASAVLSGRSGGRHRDTQLPAWFDGALTALVHAGLLTRSDRRTWRDRAVQACSVPIEAHTPSDDLRACAAQYLDGAADNAEERETRERALFGLGLITEVRGRQREPVGFDPPPVFVEPEAPHFAPRLARVVVPDPAEGPVQLLSVSLYEGGVILTWCGHGCPTFPAMSDDRGTRYIPHSGGGGGGSPGTLSGSMTFLTPGVPSDATRLTIAGGGRVRFEVAL